MPQLRSVVYKSFLTCEDPRGVIEGKTIKISKTDPTKMSSWATENETISKNSKEKEKMSLVDVKNGAQRLNEAIDSWSKGVSFRGQPKDIANDLLKGALDLQESLMMLGKLQETSYITNLKKKQEKPVEDISSRIGSGRFESFQIYDTGYQKDRKLANGSSRDCYTELRDAIREGLSKQNLLPNKSYQANAEGLSGKRKLQLSPDVASTSTSRSSSMVYSTHEFTSSDSYSSRATEEKSKGSNLIAKLMGLDEFPSKPVPCSPRKQLDITSKMRPVYDVDLPNGKKPQFSGQKMGREHMSLDEIIEMMQTKEILRNKREIKQNNRSFRDDTPPVVLMKPRRLGPDNQKIKVYDNPIRKLQQEKSKSEEILVKNRGKVKSVSNNQKSSVPAVTKPLKKQETDNKIDKIQKIVPQVKRKPIENAKSTNLISKIDSSKQQKNVVSKKNAKIAKPTIIHEVLRVNLVDQEQNQDSELTVREFDNVGQRSLCEKDSNHSNDSVTSTDHSENVVSNVNEQKARILKFTSNFQDFEPTNFGLFQDCVTEFLEHGNRIQSPLRSILSSKVFISEDIENLRNFSKFSKECSNADTVSRILERDICLSTSGTAWSTGWKDGCTVNEVEEVVLVLEKMILSRLIDDLLMEHVNKGRFVTCIL